MLEMLRRQERKRSNEEASRILLAKSSEHQGTFASLRNGEFRLQRERTLRWSTEGFHRSTHI